ncbi:hypothetical protein CVT25_009146 [Psilocybe cyanescens]|uniref:phosphoinositide phospholipase C n=1 Tax=Psilocybe cyanescens TaxID=93625 RepID=A0A409XDV3_PSICY|nr:hypothetical protein CVT25_009146 [Psilocybe cyanescens]
MARAEVGLGPPLAKAVEEYDSDAFVLITNLYQSLALSIQTTMPDALLRYQGNILVAILHDQVNILDEYIRRTGEGLDTALVKKNSVEKGEEESPTAINDVNKMYMGLNAIKELRLGANARYYIEQFKIPTDLEERWITIIYILDGTYRTLHIVAESRDVFQMWSVALQKLYATVWERQYWKGADEEGNQVLDFDDVERLCKRLNEALRKLFKELDTAGRGHLDYAQFQQFAKILNRRPELESIYEKISTRNGGKFDVAEFIKFMKELQKSKQNDEELTALFNKYARSSTSGSPNEPAEIISLEGFSNFLALPDNAAFSEQNLDIWQDMTAPISDYYISSLHNTYLVGHPLTFTSNVSMRDICEAIAKYAFVTSPYPVVISAEVHHRHHGRGVWRQDYPGSCGGSPKIAELPSPKSLKNKFLLKAKNLYVVEQLTTVQAECLAKKAAENKPATIEAPSSSSDSFNNEAEVLLKKGIADIKKTWKRLRGKGDSSNPSDAAAKESKRTKMFFRLASLLVYTVGVKCHGIAPSIEYAPEHIFAF